MSSLHKAWVVMSSQTGFNGWMIFYLVYVIPQKKLNNQVFVSLLDGHQLVILVDL